MASTSGWTEGFYSSFTAGLSVNLALLPKGKRFSTKYREAPGRIAQLAEALRLERKGWGFESLYGYLDPLCILP